jgi:hypothetical protein
MALSYVIHDQYINKYLDDKFHATGVIGGGTTYKQLRDRTEPILKGDTRMGVFLIV